MSSEPTRVMRSVNESSGMFRISPAVRNFDTSPAPLRPKTLATSTSTYRIESELGKGGMGIVYLARDVQFQRDIALKVLNAECSEIRPAYERFLEETRIAAQLQHPNIPPVHDAGTLTDGRPFLAMKLIRGRNLADILDVRTKSDVLSQRDIGIFEQICQAMAYAHSRNVIHRDLKPSNVMVGAFGEVQVMDWGLSRVLPEGGSDALIPAASPNDLDSYIYRTPALPRGVETSDGSMVGTPSFIPPEQARGQVELMGKASDVFGLGAILCVMATGKPPYAGADVEAIRYQAILGDLRECHARLKACGADPEWIELAVSCLQTERANRPADAAEVSERVGAIRAKSAERSRLAEMDSARAEVRAREERKLRLAVTAFASLAVIGITVAWGTYLWWSTRESRRERMEMKRTAQEQNRSEIGHANLHAAIEQAKTLQARGLWSQAREIFQQQRKLLATLDDPTFLQELDAAEADWKLLSRLDEIRMGKMVWMGNRFAHREANAEYREFFPAHGFPFLEADAAASVRALKVSPHQSAVIAAIDDWLTDETDAELALKINGILFAATGEAYRDPEFLSALTPEKTAGAIRELIGGKASPALIIRLSRVLNNAEMIDLFERATNVFPGDFWLHFILAEAFSRDGTKSERSIGTYRTAIALRPDSFAAWTNLAHQYSDCREYDKAVACYRRAIAVGGETAFGLTNLGGVYIESGEYASALEPLSRAVELDPTYGFAWANIGRARSRLNLEGAESALRIALSFEPKNHNALQDLCTMLCSRANPVEGIELLEKYVQYYPQDAMGWTNYGKNLKRVGRLEDARKAAEAALKIKPKLAYAHNILGLIVQEGEGPNAQALESLKRAAELEPHCEKYSREYAEALKDAGEADAAKRENERYDRIREVESKPGQKPQ